MSKKNVTTGGEIVQQAVGQAEFLLYQTEDAQKRVFSYVFKVAWSG